MASNSDPYGDLNADARMILNVLVKEWAETFAAKAREYGTMHRALGIRAQFVDSHRKMGKLQLAWWDEVDTSDWREQPREIAMDLIGHLFLAVALLDREREMQGTQPEPTTLTEGAEQAFNHMKEARVNKAKQEPDHLMAPYAGSSARACQDIHCHPGRHTFRPGCVYEKGIHVNPNDSADPNVGRTVNMGPTYGVAGDDQG